MIINFDKDKTPYVFLSDLSEVYFECQRSYTEEAGFVVHYCLEKGQGFEVMLKLTLDANNEKDPELELLIEQDDWRILDLDVYKFGHANPMTGIEMNSEFLPKLSLSECLDDLSTYFTNYVSEKVEDKFNQCSKIAAIKELCDTWQVTDLLSLDGDFMESHINDCVEEIVGELNKRMWKSCPASIDSIAKTLEETSDAFIKLHANRIKNDFKNALLNAAKHI